MYIFFLLCLTLEKIRNNYGFYAHHSTSTRATAAAATGTATTAAA